MAPYVRGPTEELYDDDWSHLPPSRAAEHWHTARAGLRTNRALDSLLDEVRERQTAQLYEDDWSTLQALRATPDLDQAATPEAAPSPSRAERNWAKARRGVQVSRAMDGVLEAARSRETEQLYDQDWTSERAEAHSTPRKDEACEGSDVAARDTPSKASPSRAAANWHKAQRAVEARIVMDNVLMSVRGKQTEDLYDQDWTASAVLKAARAAEWTEMDAADTVASEHDDPAGEVSPGGRGQDCRARDQPLEDTATRLRCAEQNKSAAA